MSQDIINCNPGEGTARKDIDKNNGCGGRGGTGGGPDGFLGGPQYLWGGSSVRPVYVVSRRGPSKDGCRLPGTGGKGQGVHS